VSEGFGDLKYQCCFCGQEIVKGTGAGHEFDPCALVLIARWAEEESRQLEQQFFCHMECFRKAAGEYAPLYIEDIQ
jgi:hypothetical protein